MKQQNFEDAFEPFRAKMEAEKLPPLVIETFRHYYSKLLGGGSGLISEEEIEPITAHALPTFSTVSDYADKGRQALRNTAIIKLNGGLGTTMGLDGPKGLLTVKGELSFFDIIALQVRALNQKMDTRIPLIMMNSFSTHAATVDYMARYGDLRTEVDSFFLQHKFPKVVKQTLEPASWPLNPKLEWNPPGHGDIYTALATSGILQQLLSRQVHYAFISNIDNLGAMMDPGLLGYFASHDFPFMMEVALRSAMDRKGGHLARRIADRQLILRELAQTPHDEIDEFQDIDKYRYFNTNSLWLNLRHLDRLLKKRSIVDLPMIRNEKFLDPRDTSSPVVYQIESAMGAAISLFSEATAVVVPATRFMPVKRCEELLVLRSDRFTLADDYVMRPSAISTSQPVSVSLDPKHFGTIDLLNQRFAAGVPSLAGCSSLTVRGDVWFGRNITIRGDIIIENLSPRPVHLPDNMMINDSITFS
jgi:UTP--glucose-1-phosphate uridylyltransferase